MWCRRHRPSIASTSSSGVGTLVHACMLSCGQSDKTSHIDTVIFHIDTVICHIDTVIFHVGTVILRLSSTSIRSSSISTLSVHGRFPHRYRHLVIL
jgi:hypothetical protein